MEHHLNLFDVLFAVTLLQSCQNGGPVQQQLNDGEVFPALELIEDGTVQDSPENEGEMSTVLILCCVRDIIWHRLRLWRRRSMR